MVIIMSGKLFTTTTRITSISIVVFLLLILLMPASASIAEAPGTRYIPWDEMQLNFRKWDSKGYFDFYPDSTIDLLSKVTRAQFAFFISHFIERDYTYIYKTDSHLFPDDLEDGTWYSQPLKYLLRKGYMDLADGGKAMPGGTITRQEAAHILSLAFYLNCPDPDILKTQIKDYDMIDADKLSGAAFMVDYKIFDLGNDMRFLPRESFLFFELVSSVDKLNELLMKEPALGATYNNDPNSHGMTVRFYDDLIKAIKSGTQIKSFDDSRLKNTYNACRMIIAEYITDDMSDYEKELLMHDYIVLTASYEEDIRSKPKSDDSYSPFGVIFNKKGACESYSRAFQILMSMCNVETLLIYGEARGTAHVWNLVKLGGNYYHVDLTFDDPVAEDEKTARINDELSKRGITSKEYFNINDRDMAKNHTWDTSKYPVCEADEYNYYTMNKTVFKSVNEAYAYIHKAFASRQKIINIRIPGLDNTKYSSLSSNIDRAMYQTNTRSCVSYYLSKEFLILLVEY
jgi:hypothetical protein